MVPAVGASIEEVTPAILVTELPRNKLEGVSVEGLESVPPLRIVTCPLKLESRLSETSIVPPMLATRRVFPLAGGLLSLMVILTVPPKIPKLALVLASVEKCLPACVAAVNGGEAEPGPR